MPEDAIAESNTKECPDLYRRSIKGGYWVIALQIALSLLGFAKSIIIANFFFLENLGILAVATMVMGAMSTFTQTGFDSALVQKKGNIQAYLDTAWTAGFIKGVLLFLTLFFSAPLLVLIKVPEDKIAITISILRVMAACFLIQGAKNVGAVFFQKELQFGKVFVMNLASSLADIVLSVVFVYVFRSIWGVIAAHILSAVVNCAGSYVLSSYRPRFRFEIDKARELWGFGKWIYGSGILGYLLTMGDNFFVWFYLGLPQLALYKYAYNFANMPATHITQVISTVSFPAYSKIQDDVPRLREAYLKILTLSSFVTIPVSFLIFILGPDFVRLFLKAHLHPMTPVLQILAFVGLITGIGATGGALLLAVRKLNSIVLIQFFRLFLLAVTIYPFTKMWGITGTAVSVLVYRVAMYPVGLFVVSKVLKCGMWEMAAPSWHPTLASLAMMGAVKCVRVLVFNETTFISFFSLSMLSLGTYLACIGFLDYIFKGGLRNILADQVYFKWSQRFSMKA